MSKAETSFKSVRVDPRAFAFETQRVPKNVDFVYVNSAYVGSVDDVNQRVQRVHVAEGPTTVIREQYWACSKWPLGQRILAITVGVLLGAVISLTLLIVLRGDDGDLPLLRTIPAPD